MKIKLATSLSVFLGAIASSSVSAESVDKPNVIFILADDLGYGDLPRYGNEIIKTPNIDALSSVGVTFTDCYAGASVSSPSRSTLMTGLHTGHTRIRGNMCRTGGIVGEREGMGTVMRINLLPQDSTVANVLSNNGYSTCLVNKWHLDGFDTTAGPLDRGFDEFYGWLIHEPDSHNFYPTVRYRNRERYIIKENLNDRRKDHNTDRATDEAIDYIRRHKDDPFFLYLAYNSPHVPLHAKDWGIYADMDMSDNDKSYAALVTHMDEAIGRVLAELKTLGLYDDAIIIFASDNGGAKAAQTEKLKLNGDLRGWKGDLYEGGIRVPLIVKLPNEQNAGRESNFPCYFPDIMPTLVDATNSHTTLKSDGVSLLPELTKVRSMNPEARYLYWEQYPKEGVSQAVRWGEWKLVRQNLDWDFELYNLADDVEETMNISDIHPEIVDQLSQYMKDAHVESEYWPVGAK